MPPSVGRPVLRARRPRGRLIIGGPTVCRTGPDRTRGGGAVRVCPRPGVRAVSAWFDRQTQRGRRPVHQPSRTDQFTRAVEAITEAYAQAGHAVDVVRRAELFARLLVGGNDPPVVRATFAEFAQHQHTSGFGFLHHRWRKGHVDGPITITVTVTAELYDARRRHGQSTIARPTIIGTSGGQLRVLGAHVPSRDATLDKTERKKRWIEGFHTALDATKSSVPLLLGDLSVLEPDHQPEHRQLAPAPSSRRAQLGATARPRLPLRPRPQLRPAPAAAPRL